MSTYILRNDEVKDRCLKEVQSVPFGHKVTISKYSKSKTGAQRNYFHQILKLVSDYTGDDQEELKMKIKYRVLPLKEIMVAGERHLYPVSSEKTTTDQYGELIEAALILADAAGVSVPNPQYYGFE